MENKTSKKQHSEWVIEDGASKVNSLDKTVGHF